MQRYARTPEQAESILSNRLYQNLAGALSGTQEYMAMEKLYELVHSDEFDVVVVDTPPTRNALDLLDAPRRLTRFLENRIFRALLVPTRVAARGERRHPGAAQDHCARSPAPRSSRTPSPSSRPSRAWKTGSGAGPAAVHELLADPATAYVLVTSARPDAVAEAGFFADKLDERDVSVAALVVNRIAPAFGDGSWAVRPGRSGGRPVTNVWSRAWRRSRRTSPS